MTNVLLGLFLIWLFGAVFLGVMFYLGEPVKVTVERAAAIAVLWPWFLWRAVVKGVRDGQD